MSKKSNIELIAVDWKDTEGAFTEITKALKKMGLYVYEAPSFEGSDMYSLIISKTPYKSPKKAEAEVMGFSMKEYKKYLNGEDIDTI